MANTYRYVFIYDAQTETYMSVPGMLDARKIVRVEEKPHWVDDPRNATGFSEVDLDDFVFKYITMHVKIQELGKLHILPYKKKMKMKQDGGLGTETKFASIEPDFQNSVPILNWVG